LPKQETLVFIETTVHMVEEKAKNQEEIQGSRKPGVFLSLCAKKGLCKVHTPSRGKESLQKYPTYLDKTHSRIFIIIMDINEGSEIL
jgi:hypothetical protein